jgi:hypothetical protein
LGKKTRDAEYAEIAELRAEDALGSYADISGFGDNIKATDELLAARADAALMKNRLVGWTSVRLALRDGFVSERAELLSRVLRIEMRLRALGFPVADPVPDAAAKT